MKIKILLAFSSALTCLSAMAFSFTCHISAGQEMFNHLSPLKIVGSSKAISLTINQFQAGQYVRKVLQETSESHLVYGDWQEDPISPFIIRFESVGTRAWVPFKLTMTVEDPETYLDLQVKYDCRKD